MLANHIFMTIILCCMYNLEKVYTKQYKQYYLSLIS